MNKEQLQKDIEVMKERLASMESTLKEFDKPKMFPQQGDEYYTFSCNGFINETTATNNDTRVNVYITLEEAEKARDIAFAKQRVKFAIEVANDGWTPDFGRLIYNYCIYKHSLGGLHIELSTRIKHQPKYMYMKSKEIAQQILANYREDLELIFSE